MRKIFDGLTLVFFAITLAVYLPANTLVNSSKVKENFIAFLPQGWAFFTKDPQEVKAIAHLVENEKLVEFNKTGNRGDYIAGLRRTQRVLGREVSDVLDQYSKSDKKKEFKTIEEALKADAIKIANTSVTRQLCGDVLVNLYKETPWVWFSNNIKTRPVNKYLKLEVECE